MTENGLFQQYFTSYRRTPSRRAAASSLSFWGKSKLGRDSLKSVSKDTLTPPADAVHMESPLTNTNGALHNDQAPVAPESVAPAPPSFDPEIFRSYLLSLLPPVVGAVPEELDSLFDHEFDERVARFAAEGGGVIYVVKAKEESEGEFSSKHLSITLNI